MAKLTHNEFRERFPGATITAWVKYRYCGGSVPGLPKEYQAVDYIASTGLMEIIELDYAPKYSTEFYVIVEAVKKANNYPFFGTRVGGTSNQFGSWYVYANSKGQYQINYGANDTPGISTDIVDLSQGKHTLYSKYSNDKMKFYTDKNEGVELNEPPSYNLGNLSLFGYTQGGQSLDTRTRKGEFKLYIARFVDDGITSINLIPCFRKEDNEIGMYDTVNGVFYTNVGEGALTKGDDI